MGGEIPQQRREAEQERDESERPAYPKDEAEDEAGQDCRRRAQTSAADEKGKNGAADGAQDGYDQKAPQQTGSGEQKTERREQPGSPQNESAGAAAGEAGRQRLYFFVGCRFALFGAGQYNR